MSGWLPAFAEEAAASKARRRSCILLWMSGGPSQMDTFDLKPGHENGGPYKTIETSVPGIEISEHLPQAGQADGALRRHPLDDDQRGRSHAGHVSSENRLSPAGPRAVPDAGLGLEPRTGRPRMRSLPNFVSIAPYRFLSPAAFGPGFLGPKYAPLIVGDGNPNQGRNADYERALRVKNLAPPAGVAAEQTDARLELLAELETDFAARHPGVPPTSHRAAYLQAVRMMRSEAVKAFDLTQEADALRDAYGRNQFGQGCLLARRLVERGVPFVEVSLNGVQGGQGLGWDTHQNNFEDVAETLGRPRPGVGHAAGGPEDAGPSRIDAGHLDGRIRAHAEDQSRIRDATISRRPGPPSCAAAEFAGDKSSARAAPTE